MERALVSVEVQVSGKVSLGVREVYIGMEEKR